jgi:hypothetical protein
MTAGGQVHLASIDHAALNELESELMRRLLKALDRDMVEPEPLVQ